MKRPQLQFGLRILMLSALISGGLMVSWNLAVFANQFNYQADPQAFWRTMMALYWANLGLSVVGMLFCLAIPPETQGRKLIVFALCANLGARALSLYPSLRWVFAILDLAGDLTLLLVLARIAAIYRRNDLIRAFGLAAVAVVIGRLSGLLLVSFQSLAWFLSMGAGLTFCAVVPFAAGRLAESVGEGAPPEDVL